MKTNDYDVILVDSGGSDRRLCRCGCALEVSIGASWRPGHYNRVHNPMTGRVGELRSDAQLAADVRNGERLRQRPTAKGIKRSDKSKELVRQARLGTKATPEARENMRQAQLGRKHPPETLAKLKAAAQARVWTEAQIAEMQERFQSPQSWEKRKLKRATQVLPVKNSKPERILQQWLTEQGFEFETHKQVKGVNHQWDVRVSSLNLLIEADGCRWHACPIHLKAWANMREKAEASSLRDQRLDAKACLLGWRVIRVWEHDLINLNFEALSEVILGK